MAEDVADVVIIGAGAAGAAVAWSLAETRMRIVCLEQGDWIAPTDYPTNHADWEMRGLGPWGFSPNTRGRRDDFRRLLVDVGANHVLARLGHGDRRRPPDAAAGAGYKYRFPIARHDPFSPISSSLTLRSRIQSRKLKKRQAGDEYRA